MFLNSISIVQKTELKERPQVHRQETELKERPQVHPSSREFTGGNYENHNY